MKLLMKPIFLFVCIVLCTRGFAQTPVAINGQLKVVGTKLVNKNGYPIQLTGKTYYTGIASGNVHQLYIGKYPAGIYVVQLINGNTRTIKRIVKK